MTIQRRDCEMWANWQAEKFLMDTAVENCLYDPESVWDKNELIQSSRPNQVYCGHISKKKCIISLFYMWLQIYTFFKVKWLLWGKYAVMLFYWMDCHEILKRLW